jgi:hypothetical protein
LKLEQEEAGNTMEFTSIGNNRFCLGVGTSERGEDIRKGCRRVNMVEILCTCVKIGKGDLLKLFQEWEER